MAYWGDIALKQRGNGDADTDIVQVLARFEERTTGVHIIGIEAKRRRRRHLSDERRAHRARNAHVHTLLIIQ